MKEKVCLYSVCKYAGINCMHAGLIKAPWTIMSQGDISKWHMKQASQQLSNRLLISKGPDGERVHLFGCLLYHSSGWNIINWSHLRQNRQAASNCYRSNVQFNPTAGICARGIHLSKKYTEDKQLVLGLNKFLKQKKTDPCFTLYISKKKGIDNNITEEAFWGRAEQSMLLFLLSFSQN